MTVAALEHKLNEMGIPNNLYSILRGDLPNEKLCLAKEDTWQVYYSERGRKSGLKEFATEAEACEYFLGKMERYAQT